MRNRMPPTSDVIIWACIAALWAASFVYASTPLNGEILCVWRRTFDLTCFGCGLTRSFMMVSDGQFVAAFKQHPVGPLLYTAMVWQVVVPAARLAFKRPDFARLPSMALRTFWITAGLLFVGHGVIVIQSWTA